MLAGTLNNPGLRWLAAKGRAVTLLFCLLSIALGTGCATSRKTTNVAGDDGSAPPRLSPAEMERRIAGLAHFATGVSLELRGETGAATDEFLTAALADPEQEPLVLDIARRLLRENKLPEAIELLQRAIKENPTSSELHTFLGIIYLQKGETNRAVDANKTAIRHDPVALAAYQNLAQIYLQLARTNDAVKVIHEASVQEVGSPEFLLGVADIYARLKGQQVFGDEEAQDRILTLLAKAGSQEISNPMVLQRIGDYYLMYGEAEKAEPFYADLLERFPEAPGLREKLANIYLRTEQNEKAATMLESLRQEKPTDPQSYYFLGALAFEGKDLSKAVDYYETAIKLNPDFEPVYYDLAGVHIAQQNPGEAVAVLEKARTRFPELNFTLEFYTGVAKGQLENYSEALTHLTSAELLAKNGEPTRLNHIFYYQLGSTYERLGNIPEAVKTFRKCLKMAPDYADAMNYLGYMWAERGENLEEAKQLIQRAVELEPENAAFLDSMGWVLYKLNDPSEALVYINKAIALIEEPDPTLYDHLGDILKDLKKTEEARAAYQKSLDAGPNEAVEKKLETLGRAAN